MLKYTICFIKQGSKVLLLNREFPDWMGVWNGVGGKIDPGETPSASILREIHEETGILLENVTYKGNVTWTDRTQHFGGMYTFTAELPESYIYQTPKQTEEGILDWKELSWITHPQNMGTAALHQYLPHLFAHNEQYEYRMIFEGDTVKEIEVYPLEEVDVALK